MKTKLFLLVFLTPVLLLAQFQQDWELKLNIFLSSNETLHSAIDLNGNVYIAGANNDVVIQKIAPNGDTLWSRIPELDIQVGSAPKVIGLFLNSSNSVFVGVTYKPDPFGFNRYFSLVSYNKAGDLVYNKRIDFAPDNDWNRIGETYRMYRENAGNFLLAGIQYNDTWYVRVDLSGNTMLAVSDTLETQYPFAVYEEPRVYISQSTGDIYCGYHAEGSDSLSQWHFGLGICKFGNDGKVVWQKNAFDYGLNETESWLINGMAGSDGQMYFNVNSQYVGGNISEIPRYQPHIIKLDSDGELVWTVDNPSELSSDIEARFNDISFDIGGNVWAVGTHESKAFVKRITGAGEVNLSTEFDDLYSGLKVTCDDRDGIAAFYDANTNLRLRRINDQGEYTTQYYIEGATIWQPFFAHNIMVDDERNIYFAHSRNDGNHLLKIYDEATGIDESGSMPEGFYLGQNYPNPFNPSTTISYSLDVETHVMLRVFDILGAEVAVLVNGIQKAGEHNVQFNAAKLSSGTYFYELRTPKNILTRKMTLIK